MALLQRLRVLNEGVCPWWLAYTFDNPARRLLHPTHRILGRYVREGMTAIDVGCGMGHFTIGMARLVGERGKVIAVDLQQEMLDVLRARAARKGVLDRIQLHRCESDRLGLQVSADFAATFWMAHEVADRDRLMCELFGLLRSGGKYLLAEPLLHVSARRFRAIHESAEAAGFHPLEPPRVAFSRTALYEKPGGGQDRER